MAAPTPKTGDTVLTLANTTVATKLRSSFLPVTGGSAYVFKTEWQADSITGGNTFAMKVEWFSDKSTSLSTDTIVSSEAAVVDTFETAARVLTAPATARWCQITLEKSAVAFNVYVDRVEMDNGNLESGFLAFYIAATTNAGTKNVFTTFATDAEDYDLNSDYDLTADEFTAPADGIYSFNAQVIISDLDGMISLSCRIRDTGNSLTLAEDNATVVPSRIIANSLQKAAAATVRLDKGDTIEAQYKYNSVIGEPDIDAKVRGTISFTEFRGRLVQAL